MKINQLLTLLRSSPETHYWVDCPDAMGLEMLVPKALSKAGVAKSGDIYMRDAGDLNREQMRDLEQDARLFPRFGSSRTHFLIRRSQLLRPASAATLLKVLEDGAQTRFIFQAEGGPQRLDTIRSRCYRVRLPFLSRQAVLGNMEVASYDAKIAQDSGLYDGCLQGTINATLNRQMFVRVRSLLNQGVKGAASIKKLKQDFDIDSLLEAWMTDQEKSLLPLSSDLAVQSMLWRMEDG